MKETERHLLAAGRVAEVHEWGPRALKLYRSPAAKRAAFREAANHAALEALGLPVPAVWGVEQVDGRWGIVFDRVGVASFAERMQADPSVIPRHLACLAQLQARIHARRAACLGSLLARPG